MKILRRYKFEASHQLPFHQGKCQRLHGHTYHLELLFSGPVRTPQAGDNNSGFVVDFGLLEDLVQERLINPYLDHHHLNDALPELPYTSAEYLAAWIMGWCITTLERAPEFTGIRTEWVRLWETESAYAEADRQDAITLGFSEQAPA